MHHRRRRLDGAAGAHRVIPAQTLVGSADISQFRQRREFGVAHALLADIAVAEEASGKGHAAHGEAFQRLGFELFADDELGGTAADIDDQPAPVLGQGVGRAEVDQACLLAPGDDLDARAEHGLGAVDQLLAIVGIAQGVGAHHPHTRGGDALEKGRKASQAVQRPRHGVLVEVAVVVQARRQLDLFAQPRHHLQPVILIVGHQQVKAVGAQIDGGQAGGVLGGVVGRLAQGAERIRGLIHGGSFTGDGSRLRFAPGDVNDPGPPRGLRSPSGLSSIGSFACFECVFPVAPPPRRDHPKSSDSPHDVSSAPGQGPGPSPRDAGNGE